MGKIVLALALAAIASSLGCGGDDSATDAGTRTSSNSNDGLSDPAQATFPKTGAPKPPPGSRDRGKADKDLSPPFNERLLFLMGPRFCPESLAVGEPGELFFDLQDTGRKDWPATFIWFEEGADTAEVTSMRLGKSAGKEVELADASVFRVGGLKAGDQKRVRLTLIPTHGDADGAFPLVFRVWGDKRNRQSLPAGVDDFHQVICTPTISG